MAFEMEKTSFEMVVGRNQICRLCALVCVCVLCGFYLDYLSYELAAKHWDLTHLTTNSSAKRLRILVVSDPQLVGHQDESYLLGPITRLDCDWYLYNGYQRALKRSKPDLVLHLGDLLDEGSKATDAEFQAYVSRFKGVFQTPVHVKQVYIPGDNDVGGEGWERIEREKLARFHKHFPSPVVSTHDFVDFVTFSDFGKSIYEAQLRTNQILSLAHQPIRIFISHLGLLDHYHYLSPQAKPIDPQLVLAGHEHWSSYISCYKCWMRKSNRKVRRLIDIDALEHNVFDKSMLYQIVSPTSSYRMGVTYPGYGLLDLDSAGNMKYRVLWLPRRYVLLYTYLISSIIIITFISRRVFKSYKHGSIKPE